MDQANEELFRSTAYRNSLVENPYFKIVQIDNKGYGAISTSSIKRGTRIIAESPLFTTSSNLTSNGTENLRTPTSYFVPPQLKSLSKEDKRKFFELHNNHVDELPAIFGILKTNAMPLGSGVVNHGIFLQCCRFNHSCDANATYAWNETVQKECIYAMKDISPGEEITVSYLPEQAFRLSSTQRKALLLSRFGFACKCELCNLPKEEQLLKDQYINTIACLDDKVTNGILIMRNPAQALKHCKTILTLRREQSLGLHFLHRSYYDAFQVCVTHGDFARAAAFASLAKDEKEICFGQDEPDIKRLKSYIKHPENHQMSGLAKPTRKWHSQTKQTREPGSEDFEHWLWARAG